MNIAVCVKQIPDPATPYELDGENHWVVRPNDQVLDDTDRFGIEVGLQVAEASEGKVTLFSMGPSGSLQGIRQALAMGADKAVLIDDETLRGSDALTTSRILAAAIEREGFDLVIARWLHPWRLQCRERGVRCVGVRRGQRDHHGRRQRRYRDRHSCSCVSRRSTLYPVRQLSPGHA